MKLSLLILTTVFLFTSCAHHHQKPKHHHHKKCDERCNVSDAKHESKFDKHCAQSVSEGDVHVLGQEDYKLSHGGEVYYFSSKEKMNMFKVSVEESIQKANSNWDGSARR